MKQIILVDVDDTIAELVPEWLSHYNKIWHDNVSPKDIVDWDISKYVKCGKVIYDLLTPDLYDSIKPVHHSHWGINYLRLMGYELIFTTSNFPISNAGRKYQWLNDNGFNVDLKHYMEAGDKSLIQCHFMIDDNIENIQRTSGTGILYEREWNKKFFNHMRMKNWQEIISFFEEIQ